MRLAILQCIGPWNAGPMCRSQVLARDIIFKVASCITSSILSKACKALEMQKQPRLAHPLQVRVNRATPLSSLVLGASLACCKSFQGCSAAGAAPEGLVGS